MRNTVKKAAVALAILGVLAIVAIAVPNARSSREVADVTTASNPEPVRTTAPILRELPTALPMPSPTFVAAVVTPAGVTPSLTATLEPAPTPTTTSEPTAVPTAAVPTATSEIAREVNPEADATGAQSASLASEAIVTPVPTSTATPTAVPTATSIVVVVEEPTATVTPTPEPSPTPTPTVEVTTAEPGQTQAAADDTAPQDDSGQIIVAGGWMYVDSDNGLYLRSDPAGAILAVLTHRSQVHATGRAVDLENRTWMEVDVPANGWVALQFLSTDEPSAAVVETQPSSGEPPTAEDWALLRNCESTNRYNIVDASGLYHGAYQFLPSTWDGLASRFRPDLVGVLPSQASPADQDAMALQLYELEGARPWPTCGRFLL